MDAFVEAENLTRTYGAVCAVDRVSFRIKKGEVVGLLGPNGAGKTTTMKMLTCFMPPTDGRVRVAGLDVVEHSLEVRRRIGYLPENVPLYDEMGVWEYLEFMARVRGIEPARQGRAIRQAVSRCGLGAMIGKPVSALSKGYRQRLGLAQAVIHDPDLVILDEPTTGLDPNQIVEIRQLIRQLGSEKTVLLSTHILQEVEAVCDRVLIINDGRIIADGTPAQLHSEFQGAQELSLLIGGPGREELAAALEGLPGAGRVQVGAVAAPATAAWPVSVTSGKDDDLREAIFRLCVARGWVLLEMHRRVVSLEDIFRKLTVGADA